MPTLSGDAKRAYVRAYGQYEYNRYCDDPGTFHGSTGPPDPDELPPFEFCHRPDHDVESIFWVLLATLLRAQPFERTKDPNLKPFWAANESFLDHVIQKGVSIDSRDHLLVNSKPDMELILDPKLAPLSQMLADMAAHVLPEYGYLSPPPPKDHLHEVMRRLLLKQIIEMTDEIKLCPGVSRPLSQDEVDDNKPTGTKRKSQRQGGTKGKRSKLSTVDSRQGSRPQHQQ